MSTRWCCLIVLAIAGLGLEPGCRAVASHRTSEEIRGCEERVESIFPGEDIRARAPASPQITIHASPLRPCARP